jgi:hypothetical protein
MEIIKIQRGIGVIVFSGFRYGLRKKKNPIIPLEFLGGVPPLVGASCPACLPFIKNKIKYEYMSYVYVK